MKINPLLLLDFYKTCHSDQYPKGMNKLVSYYIPRMSRLQNQKEIVMFGLQAYIKKYLIDMFNQEFFNRERNKIVTKYKEVLDATLGEGIVDYEKISSLWGVGYLPLEIWALPEGTLTPIGVPMIQITNTHPDFAWLVNTIETQMSCTLWHAQMSATIGYMYRQIANEAYAKTVDNEISPRYAIGDFSMRGQESVESAIKSSAGFCLSFLSTATVPSANYFVEYYNADLKNDKVIIGTSSTEHSVMNSNFAIDGDEITMIKRLLTEIYPNKNFTMVSDSYDYWNLVDNLLPRCRKEILNHNGFIGIRGDSGDPVEIVTKTVEKIWESFPGYVNSKGYRVIDPRIKVVYGDSITLSRAKRIYEILEKNYFAANNVSLAAGSFSMQCMEEPYSVPQEDDKMRLNPFTRDTFGIAVKSTYCEVNGEPIHIFKDPKTDTGNFKKSHKGCCGVFNDSQGNIVCQDGLDWNDLQGTENLLKPVFKDSKMINETSLNQVRETLHPQGF